MSGSRWLAAGILFGLMGAMVWQRTTAAGLRDQKAVLQTALSDAMSRAENVARQDAQLARMGDQGVSEAHRELLRLRNEVSRLRAQRTEMDRLKNDNSRRASEVRSSEQELQEFQSQEGYLAKESWSNVGFDTPEATMQTFLWAVRTEDIVQVAECMPERERGHLLALAQPGNEAQRDKALADMRQMTAGPGLRIVKKVTVEEGVQTNGGAPEVGAPRVATKVQVHLQAVPGGAVVPMTLVRGPQGWKIKIFEVLVPAQA